MFRYCLWIFAVFFNSYLSAQTPASGNYPTDYFRRPLDLPPILSGNFGELRSNHFHSGLDFKTNQREGYPVYATADGYVSRIRVQIGGGGNAVYLNHPNGFTTVHMHLQRFNPAISKALIDYQYGHEQFDVDFGLPEGAIPVRKGEVIAWSGNTGGSSGPHLHYEIRDTKSEETINPQLFGITVPDRVKPTISGLYVYDLNQQPFSENTPKKHYSVTGAAGKYRLNPAVTVPLAEETAFGIMAIDYNSASQNTNGPYSIELQIDGETIYLAEWERFSFANSRAINSHLDHPLLIGSARRVQKSFREPGNKLEIYKKLVNDGRVSLSDNEVHDARYIVRDVAGNESTLEFKIRRSVQSRPSASAANTRLFRYDQRNVLDTNNIRLEIDTNTLYSDLNFRYTASAMVAGAYSPTHHVHSRLIPVHQPFRLSIKPTVDVPPALRDKLLIVNSRRGSQGGEYRDGYVSALVRGFDSYYITADTTPPRITALSGTNLRGASRIRFTISDNLSGIKSFSAKINGSWVLMEYEPKTSTIWHTFDSRTGSGTHDFELMVCDGRDNISVYRSKIER